MPKFIYKVVTKENKLEEGSLVSFLKSTAHKQLSKNGATVLYVTREKTPFKMPSLGFSKTDRILFFRNFSTMLSANLSLPDALSILEQQVRGAKVRGTIKKIRLDVQNGKSLSTAMQKYPKYFPEFLTEIIHVGEIGGKLSDALERIAAELERDYELTLRVRSAMAYPIILVTAMLIVIAGLIFYVLPKLIQLFDQLRVSLPLPTRILIGLGDFIRAYPAAIPLIFAAVITAFIVIRRNARGRYILHRILLSLPVFGKLIKEFNLTQFFRAVRSLYLSGLSLVQSVEIAKKVLKNEVYKKALDAVHPMLVHGIPLSEALRPFPSLFPNQTQRVIQVAERSGKLDDVFELTAKHYERSLRNKIDILPSLIEPTLILVLGLIIGALALSIFMPIYQIINKF